MNMKRIENNHELYGKIIENYKKDHGSRKTYKLGVLEGKHKMLGNILFEETMFSKWYQHIPWKIKRWIYMKLNTNK